MAKGISENSQCAECGMTLQTTREFHPWAACVFFKAGRTAPTVRGNIKAIVEYGMKAQKKGVSLKDAMADVAKVV